MRSNFQFQFLLIGVFLFFLFSFFDKRKPSNNNIYIEHEEVKKLINNWKEMTGQFPDKIQTNALINDYLKEEMYVRKALSYGLEQNDPTIRKILANRYQFVAGETFNATVDSSLMAEYYNQNINRYKDSLYTFYQFSISYDDFNNKEELYHKFMEHLNTQPLPSKLIKENTIQYLPNKMEIADFKKVVRAFGKPFAETISTAESNRWIGPVKSGYAYHLIYIKEKIYQVKDFVNVQERVTQDYLLQAKSEWENNLFERELANFNVTIDTSNIGVATK